MSDGTLNFRFFGLSVGFILGLIVFANFGPDSTKREIDEAIIICADHGGIS